MRRLGSCWTRALLMTFLPVPARRRRCTAALLAVHAQVSKTSCWCGSKVSGPGKTDHVRGRMGADHVVARWGGGFAVVGVKVDRVGLAHALALEVDDHAAKERRSNRIWILREWRSRGAS